MMDDTVGKPIFFVDNGNSTGGILDVFADLNLNPSVVLLVMARLEALAQAVDEGVADGIIIGSCDGNTLSLTICDKNGERVIEEPVPNLSEEKVVAWIISNIQGVGSKLNLITDPALCQCFCGFAGHPNDWLEVLLADMI